MKLLITDTTIVTCDANRRIIDRGSIAIAGNRIVTSVRALTWTGLSRL